eukprot:TRINITY_DN8601_c0_g1_i2.p1 TRINITY_DN8601_c0_g1~~TRINITY_DN8601_c0_g1_i2.p1  ORF type:complete len:140 (-),score=39.30 TRINITY_DN8601_c0_g1_i2:19-378(-)
MDDVFDSGEDAEKKIAENDLRIHNETIVNAGFVNGVNLMNASNTEILEENYKEGLKKGLAEAKEVGKLLGKLEALRIVLHIRGESIPDYEELKKNVVKAKEIPKAVSYTHLTLPTIYSV